MTAAQQSSPQWAEGGLVIGVDVGGTKVAAGAVNGKGEIFQQARMPMVSNGGPEAGLAAVTAAIGAVSANVASAGATQGWLRGIGICAPGPLEPKRGIVLNPPNLPCWRNFPLADEVSQTYNVPVRVDNDANAAALAEALWGAGRGYRHVFYATIGTGIGSGIVLDGQIYGGRTGAAGEGGHVSIDYHGPRCACGKPGCIEVFAAGPAIAKRARAKLEARKNHGSSLPEMAGGSISAVTTEIVGQACAAGDPVAQETLRETVELLALWLSNMVDLLEPDVVIIGGGVSAILKPFFEQMQSLTAGFCVNPRAHEIPLVRAFYGTEAGIAGGAALSSAELAEAPSS